MKLIKRVSCAFKSISLKKKLFLAFMTLVEVPLVIIGIYYYDYSSKTVLESTAKSILGSIQKNVSVTDFKLTQIEDSVKDITVDSEIYDIFVKIQLNKTELVYRDQKLEKLIYKYLGRFTDIYSVSFVTSYYSFGNGPMYIPREKFFMSDISFKALMENGKLCWIPTYSFEKMYGQQALAGIDYEYKYLFSAVKLVNFAKIIGNSTLIGTMKDNLERPYLVISFTDDFFRQVYDGSLPFPGAAYYVITDGGRIVSHSDPAMLTKTEVPDWLEEAASGGEGYKVFELNGKQTLVCYATSSVNGWIHAAEVPIDGILSTITRAAVYNTIIIAVLTVISALLVILISNQITQPILNLTTAVQRMGEGKFNYKVQETGNDEIGILIRKYNEMDDHISRLITENYETRLREKDARIMALNVQLNPHFLYNTLNIINWIAIDNNQDEISEMLVKLSKMLKYTTENSSEIVTFNKDFEWLEGYVGIMSKRFESKFRIGYDIDPEVFKCLVPKLFLQPIIENAILHGFAETMSGGLIRIGGRIEDGCVRFSVMDNGKGMDDDTVRRILDPKNQSIGVSNTNNRIKLLYGQEYGIVIRSGIKEGTMVEIVFPFESSGQESGINETN